MRCILHFSVIMRLYIISNRLPVKVSGSSETGFNFSRSEGGLTTGLDSLEITDEKHWIGWPGICSTDESDQHLIRAKLEKMSFHPVFLSEKQYENYYEGYSNSTLWPLCHYFYAYTQYQHNFWDAYREVNELFCEEVCKIIDSDDWVWVQDYQLMLLPQLLRERFPSLHIGYFHHIPFPSYELFRILPERSDILKGLLGADFIGFHTYDYVRHFISAVERVLHVDFTLEEARVGNRVVGVDALPMGINYDLYQQASGKKEVKEVIERTRKQFGDNKLILSVDRLDYSKGILHRLDGFSKFLSHHPEYHGKVTLAMVIVPSRDHVDRYAELKNLIDKEIGSINGKYSTMDWTPVCYFYHGFSLEELTAFYYVADVAMVTPLRDGMNLVAKEYVATKKNNPGVLILSEMAGAAVELGDALLINPNDADQVESALFQALEMDVTEQLQRLRAMQEVVSRQTVNKWAADFIESWKRKVQDNEELKRKRVTPYAYLQIKEQYDAAKKRLIVLDYDGTLVGFENRPEDAKPTSELMNILRDLSADKRNHVVISSGRDHYVLDSWLGSLPISFAAEHGALYKEHGEWHKNLFCPEWSGSILSILKLFVDKTPKSRIEKKETSLAWHYREVDAWLGEIRSKQLVNMLVDTCLKQNLQILQGNKVVEIKNPSCTKGSEVKRLLHHHHYDFIMAIGDDETDEDMFRALPSKAVTIKVGTVSANAQYNLLAQTEVLPFLKSVMVSDKFDFPPKKLKWREKLCYLLGITKRTEY